MIYALLIIINTIHDCIFIIGEVLYDSDDYFGYWSYNRYYYYSCSGDEHSLESCTSYYYGDCNSYYDAAGVRCVQC